MNILPYYTHCIPIHYDNTPTLYIVYHHTYCHDTYIVTLYNLSYHHSLLRSHNPVHADSHNAKDMVGIGIMARCVAGRCHPREYFSQSRALSSHLSKSSFRVNWEAYSTLSWGEYWERNPFLLGFLSRYCGHLSMRKKVSSPVRWSNSPLRRIIAWLGFPHVLQKPSRNLFLGEEGGEGWFVRDESVIPPQLMHFTSSVSELQ